MSFAVAGAVLPEWVLPAVTSFEWSADGGCLYYTVNDHTGRPSKVGRHAGIHQTGAASNTHHSMVQLRLLHLYFITLFQLPSYTHRSMVSGA